MGVKGTQPIVKNIDMVFMVQVSELQPYICFDYSFTYSH